MRLEDARRAPWNSTSNSARSNSPPNGPHWTTTSSSSRGSSRPPSLSLGLDEPERFKTRFDCTQHGQRFRPDHSSLNPYAVLDHPRPDGARRTRVYEPLFERVPLARFSRSSVSKAQKPGRMLLSLQGSGLSSSSSLHPAPSKPPRSRQDCVVVGRNDEAGVGVVRRDAVRVDGREHRASVLHTSQEDSCSMLVRCDQTVSTTTPAVVSTQSGHLVIDDVAAPPAASVGSGRRELQNPTEIEEVHLVNCSGVMLVIHSMKLEHFLGQSSPQKLELASHGQDGLATAGWAPEPAVVETLSTSISTTGKNKADHAHSISEKNTRAKRLVDWLASRPAEEPERAYRRVHAQLVETEKSKRVKFVVDWLASWLVEEPEQAFPKILVHLLEKVEWDRYEKEKLSTTPNQAPRRKHGAMLTDITFWETHIRGKEHDLAASTGASLHAYVVEVGEWRRHERRTRNRQNTRVVGRKRGAILASFVADEVARMTNTRSWAPRYNKFSSDFVVSAAALNLPEEEDERRGGLFC